ncbi:hypothetical protein COO60DRAFT_1507630, partial [Scenedesmus sp. NREL 46B-D3]
MIKTKRGSFRPNNGVADSGCVPDLIFSGQAKDAGLYIHLFAEDEKPKVLNIEGAGMTRIIGRTEPASVVFGQGTAAEMEVPLHDGFLVVDNPAVERMYSCVFGRSCLDQVSGFVVPYLQAFFYMPRMKQLDTTLAHMPVKIGSSEQRKSMASLAALANQLPAFACAVTAEPPPQCRGTGQGLDEEDTTGQGTGTISLQPELPCSKVPPPKAECCCTEPAQHATLESVVPSFVRTSAAAVVRHAGKQPSSWLGCMTCCYSNRPTRREAQCTTAWDARTAHQAAPLTTLGVAYGRACVGAGSGGALSIAAFGRAHITSHYAEP